MKTSSPLAEICRRNRLELLNAQLSRRLKPGLLTGAGTLAVSGGLSQRALAGELPRSPPTMRV